MPSLYLEHQNQSTFSMIRTVRPEKDPWFADIGMFHEHAAYRCDDCCVVSQLNDRGGT